MAIPDRTTANSRWYYHVYDIPCAHAVAGPHAGGCGPHVSRTQFPSAHVDSWLPLPPAAAPAGPAVPPPPVHQARADVATRTQEEVPLQVAAALPANINVHPIAAGDQTGNARLSLLQDMSDLQTVAGAVASLNAISGPVGTTYFGRQIPYIMFGGNNDPAAPQVLLTGGVHAREWMAVEVPYLIAEYMVKNYLSAPNRGGSPASQVRMSEVIDACRICVVPMLNPDGNCWSVASANMDVNFRRWRRNRRRWRRGDLVGPGMRVQLTPAPPATVYTGVDCNRNFPRRCGGNWPQTNPTREGFAGPKHACEAETRSLLDFIGGNLPNLAGSIDYHSARGRVFYHGDARAGRGRRGDTRELVRTVAQCMWNHIHAYGAAADYGTGHTTAEEDIQGAESYGSVMDGCYDMMLGNKKVPLAYTIELDPIKAAGGAYNPVCNADYRWFSIPENGIQQVFEKNLTAALCLIRYASVGFASKMFHAVRGANGVTVGADTCPFLHGGGGNDMVAKIVNRGNQPPNP